MSQDDVVTRAKSGIAIQKLVPVGEYLDLADSTSVLESNPTRYQALSVAALDILRQFRTDTRVRETCQESTALQELLDNVDFEAGTGVLAPDRIAVRL
jgi:hypothetical protein